MRVTRDLHGDPPHTQLLMVVVRVRVCACARVRVCTCMRACDARACDLRSDFSHTQLLAVVVRLVVPVLRVEHVLVGAVRPRGRPLPRGVAVVRIGLR